MSQEDTMEESESSAPRWDEVGERFTRLGHTLQDRWSERSLGELADKLQPRRD